MPIIFLIFLFFLLNPPPLFSDPQSIAQTTPSINKAFYFAVEKTSRYRVNGYSNLVELQKLLDQGADINAYEKDEKTPLIAAIWNGDLPTVKFLLVHGADPNLQRKKGDNLTVPLSMVAVTQGLSPEDVAQMVGMLIHYGAKPNVQNQYGQTPLMTMAQYGQAKAVEVLIKSGADVTLKNKNDETALMLAAEAGHPEILTFLLKAHPPTQDELDKTLCFGVWKAQRDAVRILVGQMEKIPPCALAQASGMKNAELVEDLLKLGADPNGVDPRFGTPLLIAVESRAELVVDALLKSHANPDFQNEDGWTPLMRAAYEGHLDILKKLLSAQANPNKGRKYAQTALTFAVEKERLDCVVELLNAGVDFADRELGHWRALHVAAEKGNAELITLLLKHGAPVDSRDREDKTPLIIACDQGHLAAVKVLVEQHADLEAVNSRMMMNDVGDNFIGTPLLWAQKNNHQEIVQYLLSQGANPKPHISRDQSIKFLEG